MHQLDLTLATAPITGQAAVRLIPQENLRRLLDRGLVKRGVAFYVLCNQHGSRVWNGRGKVPVWVKDWQAQHGSLDALKATL